MRRGCDEYDVLLTREDFAVFTDSAAEQCINVGICDLPEAMHSPSPPRQQVCFQNSTRSVSLFQTFKCCAVHVTCRMTSASTFIFLDVK